ncbi:hypothetical protein, partial [Cyanobium sp. BA5m-10]|uniref:hypothetical protein n=1 Tax=Cyanobium sp. BA5m-10 TaxID=2823705 RepID=UPI0020CE35C7
MIAKVLPSGVLPLTAAKLPLMITLSPPTVRPWTPSGAEIVNVPPWVVDSLLASDPADSPLLREASRSSSLTLTSPPSAFG